MDYFVISDLARDCIEFRAAHNLTQDAFAKICGVSRSTIIYAERGGSVLAVTEAKIRLTIRKMDERSDEQ